MQPGLSIHPNPASCFTASVHCISQPSTVHTLDQWPVEFPSLRRCRGVDTRENQTSSRIRHPWHAFVMISKMTALAVARVLSFGHSGWLHLKQWVQSYAHFHTGITRPVTLKISWYFIGHRLRMPSLGIPRVAVEVSTENKSQEVIVRVLLHIVDKTVTADRQS